MANYEVIVGNIGTVYTGGFIDSARAKFAVYKQQSISGVGRAGGEPVTLMKDGEPFEEFLGADEQDQENDDLHQYDYINQAWLVNGLYITCSHVDACDCYGKAHAGETAAPRADIHPNKDDQTR